MKYLLDTHVLIWASFEEERLSGRVVEILDSEENEVMVSAASAWEIATKVRLGKLPNAHYLSDHFVESITESAYLLLDISAEHALRAGRMVGAHKDPFDRLLAAKRSMRTFRF
jgi:PIN domain nuclease of toxin-antitoxin system